MSNNKKLGKFRGVVTDNDDPSNLGRIKAEILGLQELNETGWALPCFPYAGNGVGFIFIPEKGSHVWMEFEQGNIERPIWTGCFISEPSGIQIIPDRKMIVTKRHSIILDDTPSIGIISIESGGVSIKLEQGEGKITIKVN